MKWGTVPEKDIIGYIQDPLYGPLPYSKEDLEIYQTREVARMGYMTQGSEPFGMCPYGVPSTRLLHSFGAQHLSSLVGLIPEFRFIARELRASGIGHDTGHLVFSHMGQHYFKIMFHKEHEEVSQGNIEDGEIGKVMRRQGIDTQIVGKLITGQLLPYSLVISGTADTDNLDNIKRFGMCTGVAHKLLFRSSTTYNPASAAQGFRIVGNKLCMLASEEANLYQWQNWRKVIYDHIYSAPHQRSASMIFRALEFAMQADELSFEFFYLNDVQAIVQMQEQMNPITQELTKMALSWNWYEPVFFEAYPQDRAPVLPKSLADRNRLADEVAKQAKIPSHHVCTYFGWNKGVRELGFDFVTEEGELRKPQPSSYTKTFALGVFLHPKWAGTSQAQTVIRYVQSIAALDS